MSIDDKKYTCSEMQEIWLCHFLSFWKSNRDEVLKLTIEQVMSNAGDGNLRDTSQCSQELRQSYGSFPLKHFAAMLNTAWIIRLIRAV